MKKLIAIFVGVSLVLLQQNCAPLRGVIYDSKISNSLSDEIGSEDNSSNTDNTSSNDDNIQDDEIPPIVSSEPQPQPEKAIWVEGFENGLGNWRPYDGAGPGNIEIAEGIAHSGQSSLRLRFDSLSIGQGPFMDRTFPNSTHVFMRYWMKTSKGFQFAG